MAQLVKLEPGDILVLANVGEEQAQALREHWDAVRDAIGIERVWVFEGDVDLSKVPSDAVGFAARTPGDDHDDGGE